MKIDRSKISHYFCIAPESFSQLRIESHATCSQGCQAVAAFGELQLGIKPPSDAVKVGAYDDNTQLGFGLLKQALHQLGIRSGPRGDPSHDPSIIFQITTVTGDDKNHNSAPLVIGLAYANGATIQQASDDDPLTYF